MADNPNPDEEEMEVLVVEEVDVEDPEIQELLFPAYKGKTWEEILEIVENS